mgnify:CR=1 FL=1
MHGGLTYSRDFLWISKERKLQGWFIGWDYAHYGDYVGYELMFPKEFKIREEKKWLRQTTYPVDQNPHMTSLVFLFGCKNIRDCTLFLVDFSW